MPHATKGLFITTPDNTTRPAVADDQGSHVDMPKPLLKKCPPAFPIEPRIENNAVDKPTLFGFYLNNQDGAGGRVGETFCNCAFDDQGAFDNAQLFSNAPIYKHLVLALLTELEAARFAFYDAVRTPNGGVPDSDHRRAIDDIDDTLRDSRELFRDIHLPVEFTQLCSQCKQPGGEHWDTGCGDPSSDEQDPLEA